MNHQASSPSALRVWLITGSTSGLGLALTSHALSQGDNVIATSRSKVPSGDLASLLAAHPTSSVYIPLDLSVSTTVIKETITTQILTLDKFGGRVDVVANVAGFAVMGSLEHTDLSILGARQMQTNFMGPLAVIQSILPLMRSQGSGTIINVSSAQGPCPSPANGMYAASKAALEAASESLRDEVRPFGIRVVVVVPGAFRTGFAGRDAATYVDPVGPYAEEGHPVAQRFAMLEKYGSGAAKGDPEKAAKIMWEAARGVGEAGRLVHEENLLRLVLGPDCWLRVDEKVTELRRTANLSRNLAESTNL
ncbi:hypothetical protein HKX48_007885 [Thoreauomyces humboldtii]|nr:hypothetical protein HKX48_007885 [Thoreauomyces humboldtii]